MALQKCVVSGKSQTMVDMTPAEEAQFELERAPSPVKPPLTPEEKLSRLGITVDELKTLIAGTK